jgi:hypothetical protein
MFLSLGTCRRVVIQVKMGSYPDEHTANVQFRLRCKHPFWTYDACSKSNYVGRVLVGHKVLPFVTVSSKVPRFGAWSM